VLLLVVVGLVSDYLLLRAARFSCLVRSVGFSIAMGGLRGVRTTGLNALAALGVNGRDTWLTWSPSSTISLLLKDYKSTGLIILLTLVQLCGVTGQGPLADRILGGMKGLFLIM